MANLPPPSITHPTTTAMNLTHNENPWQQQQTHSEDTPTADLLLNPPRQPSNPNSTHNIKSTMANLHNSKPSSPIYCTTTHRAPDPLRPRFTNHYPVATRSEGFIAEGTNVVA